MNASRVLRSCSDKHQEGPADTREARTIPIVKNVFIILNDHD